jgi:hypothetical protein
MAANPIGLLRIVREQSKRFEPTFASGAWLGLGLEVFRSSGKPFEFVCVDKRVALRARERACGDLLRAVAAASG